MHFTLHLYIFLALLLNCGIHAIFNRHVQSVAVKGTLMCDGKPAKAIKVKLYEHDTFTLDDLMDTRYTDDDGNFMVSGKETESGDIKPHVNIYHKCRAAELFGAIKLPCPKKVKIEIPKDYITQGETPTKVFDIGRWNLEGSFSGESHDCIN